MDYHWAIGDSWKLRSLKYCRVKRLLLYPNCFLASENKRYKIVVEKTMAINLISHHPSSICTMHFIPYCVPINLQNMHTNTFKNMFTLAGTKQLHNLTSHSTKLIFDYCMSAQSLIKENILDILSLGNNIIDNRTTCINMQVFEFSTKMFLISDQNPKDLNLVSHWVSTFIHLTQMNVIYWPVTLWIIVINEFEEPWSLTRA